MSAREAVALALSFAEGMRNSGASAEAQAEAMLGHLASSGFSVLPRVRREKGRRRPSVGEPDLTGADVRAARAAVGLDRSKLADMAGIKRRTLQDIESGRRVAQQRTIEAIGTALEAARPTDTPGHSDDP